MKKLSVGLMVLGLVCMAFCGDATARPGRGGGPGGAGPARGQTPARTPSVSTRQATAEDVQSHVGPQRGNRAESRSEAAGNLQSSLQPRPQPFTPAWYTQHPHAWHAAHPHADLWVAASLTGVAAWLAIPVTSGSSGGTYVTESTTYVNEVVQTPQQNAPIGEEPSPSPSDRTVPAALGTSDDPQWLSLGVYSLKPAGETAASRVIQISIGRDGSVRGSQVDKVTQGVENVQGSVDKASMRIRWTIGGENGAVFEAALAELTAASGSVSVRFPDGQTTTWEMAKINR